MRRFSRQFVERSIKASGWWLPLLVPIFFVPQVWAFVIGHKLLVAAAFAVIEGITVFVVWSLTPRPEEAAQPVLTTHSLQKVRTEIRFVTGADFAGMDRIFDSTLDPEEAMDDADFLELMNRGNLMRVMQEDFVTGSERISRIAGYYSFWPLRAAEFDLIVKGTLKEEHLRPCDIPDLDDPEVKVLYLSEVCSADDADHRSMLMRDMLRYILLLLNKHPNIESIAAWPSSDDGKRWSEKLGLKPCRPRWRGRSVHALDRRAILASPHLPSGQFKERVVINY